MLARYDRREKDPCVCSNLHQTDSTSPLHEEQQDASPRTRSESAVPPGNGIQ